MAIVIASKPKCIVTPPDVLKTIPRLGVQHDQIVRYCIIVVSPEHHQGKPLASTTMQIDVHFAFFAPEVALIGVKNVTLGRKVGILEQGSIMELCLLECS